MEAIKIVAACVVAGAVYGILHDQVTARVCLQYFTVFHPDIFHTQSPTLLAIGWGVLATWWVSLPLGILLFLAARAGSKTKLTSTQIVPKLLKLIAFMAVSALAAGIMGYFLQGFGMEYYATAIPKEIRRPFYADLWAHEASYLTGLVGGVVLCIFVWRERKRIEIPGSIERQADYIRAHKHCIENRAELETSVVCGCFYCLSIYPPSEIVDWIEDKEALTADCPRCGIDAVIGSASGFPITPGFLNSMNEHWFEGHRPA